MNAWEKEVVKAEMERVGTIAWYRNPSRANQESLGIVYANGGEYGVVRPDFVFFAKLVDGTVVADIVDPHGPHLADALPKLRGLAAYVEKHGAVVRRVESIAVVNGKHRVLDLTEKKVREILSVAVSATDLYLSDAATDYVV